MAKKVLVISMIVILVVMISVAGYFIYGALKSGQTLSIAGFFNKDKQEIGGEQSVIAGVEGVKYITLKVEVENKDSVPLDFKIIDASPSSFKTALNLNSVVTADKGQKASWTSGLVDIEPFEGTTQEFSVTIEGISDLRDKANKTSKISIKIDPDPQSSFDVVITSEVNNDGTFEPPEDNTTQPPANQDQKVLFRTTDIIYGSGSAVALANSCGSSLIAYGRTNGACSEFSCNGENYNLLIPSGKLWNKDSENVCICEQSRTSGYPYRYSTTDSDASKVSTSLSQINNNLELVC